MEIQYDNLIYMAFVNIEQAREVVSYPTNIPIVYEKIISFTKERVLESLRESKTDVSEIVVEGASLFFLADDDNKIGAYLLTLGDNYPRRFANSLLKDLINVVLSNGYDHDSTTSELQYLVEDKLKEIFHKYDSVVEKDQVTLVRVKTELAKENIRDSLMQVMETAANVELLKKTSENLKVKSQQAFETSKKANKHFGKYKKVVCFLIYFVIYQY
uniref:V-SNARE coiled-coil homology domain-containing protein n=1 Tax=Theileria annulata TaxID=5874 RepID=A0A3B0MWC8_THEAN